VKVIINGYTSSNGEPIIDLSKYMADVEACHSSLLEFIKKPMVDTEKPKPVDQLLRSICYLSF